MNAVVCMFLVAIFCCPGLRAQEMVTGIPSAVTAVTSNGNGVVAASTTGRRVYLSRDSGKTFVAIDTTDELRQPLINSYDARWFNPSPATMCFDAPNNVLWVLSMKGWVLCKLDLATGKWSMPLPIDTSCPAVYPYISTIAVGFERTVVVDYHAGVEGTPCHRIFRSDDLGETWYRLPDLIDSLPGQAGAGDLVVTADGDVVASFYSTHPLDEGIFRLSKDSTRWTRVLTRKRGIHFVERSGTTIYAGAESDVYASTDNGNTFNPIHFRLKKDIECLPWRGDTVVFVGRDSNERWTSSFKVVDTTVLGELTAPISHKHVSPFVGAIPDSSTPKLLVSGNGFTESIDVVTTTRTTLKFIPETYRAYELSRVVDGLVAYVEQHGLFWIDNYAFATFDSTLTYNMRRRPTDVSAWSEAGFVYESNGVYIYCTKTTFDTIGTFLNVAGLQIHDPMVHNDTVFAGVKNRGLVAFPLSDTSRKTFTTDGIPTSDVSDTTELLSVAPIGSHQGRLISLLDGYQTKAPYKISPNGGVFLVGDDFTRVNDTALDDYRLMINSTGDCWQGTCTFSALDESPRNGIMTSLMLVYRGGTNTVSRITSVQQDVGFPRSTVVDSLHVAITGWHDTLKVFDLASSRFTQDIVGITFSLSTLNGKVALATMDRGIVVYPLDILTSIDNQTTTSTSHVTVWPNPTSEVLSISFPHTDVECVVSLVNSLGETVMVQRIPAGQSLVFLDIHAIGSGLYLANITDESLRNTTVKVAVCR